MKKRILFLLFMLQILGLIPLAAQPCVSLPGLISCNSSCFSSGLTIFGDGSGGSQEATCSTNCTSPVTEYQWQKNEGSGWMDITGANQKNYTIPSLIVSTDFRRNATCDGTVMQQSNKVTVNPIPPAPTISTSGPTTFCAGGSVQLNSSVNSGNQWFKDAVIIAGATNAIYMATQSGNYTVKQTVSGCQSGASNGISVTVNPIPPAPTISTSGPTTFCAGGSVILNSSVNSGNQWFKDAVIIPGATNATYVATQSGNFTVKQTFSGCQSGASNAVSVTVNPIPPDPIISPNGPTTFCAGGSVQLNSSVNSGNQWFKDAIKLDSATNATYIATQQGNYTVKQTVSGCQSGASNIVLVTVNPLPVAPITYTPQDPKSCSGTDGRIVFTGYIGLHSYELIYKFNGNMASNIITSDAMGKIELIDLKAGSYKDFVVKDRSTLCLSSANNSTILLSDPKRPEKPSNIRLSSQFLCGIDNWVTVTVDPSVVDSFTWDISPKGFMISGNSTNQIQFKPNLDSVDYTITVTRTNNSTKCTSDPSSMILPVYRSPKLSIVGPDMICEKDNQLLSAAGSGGQKPYLYYWTVNGVYQGNSDKLNISSFKDGVYDISHTITDSKGCKSALNKNLLVKNVPDFDVNILTSAVEGERTIVPIISNGSISEIDSICYTFKLNNTIERIIMRDTNRVLKQLISGQNYDLIILGKLKNGCSIMITKMIHVNPSDCKFYVTALYYRDTVNSKDIFITNLSETSAPTIPVCEKDSLEHYFIRVKRQGFNKVKLNYMGDTLIFPVMNGEIDIPLGFVKLKVDLNEFSIPVEYFLGTDALMCSLNFSILNQSRPKIDILEKHYCHLNPLPLNFSSTKNLVSYSVNNRNYKLPNQSRVDTTLSNATNMIKVILTNIKEDNNTCPLYSDTFNVYVYRTPIIEYQVDKLCNDNVLKPLIKKYPEDFKATFVWKNNDTLISILNCEVSGTMLSSNNKLDVIATIIHQKMGESGNIPCQSDTSKDIHVFPLPLAEIGEYSPGCGPFFKVNSLHDPENNDSTKFLWKSSNGNNGIKIGERDEFFALTGNGADSLMLTAISDEGCSHSDKVILGKRNFDLEQDETNKLKTSICKDSSLYYLEKPNPEECYKWFILDTVNFKISTVEKGNPFLKSKESLYVFMLKYPCGENCAGTLVSRGKGEYNKNCDEVDSEYNIKYRVYPVPANNWVILQSDYVPRSERTIKVFNGIGHIINTAKVMHLGGNFIYKLDLANIQSGIYFFQINEVTYKFIVTK